jgi:hypothetical protein
LPFSSTDGRPERGREEPWLRHDLRVVEECDAYVRRTVLGLSRLAAESPLEEVAREVLRELRPLLEEALAALRRIEDLNGGLTERELACRRAFVMLLEVPDWEREDEVRRTG